MSTSLAIDIKIHLGSFAINQRITQLVIFVPQNYKSIICTVYKAKYMHEN